VDSIELFPASEGFAYQDSQKEKNVVGMLGYFMNL
jgi:hypothetical protein